MAKMMRRMMALALAFLLVFGQVATPATAVTEGEVLPQGSTEEHGSTSVIGNEDKIIVTEVSGEKIVETEDNTTTTTETSSVTIEGVIVSDPEVAEDAGTEGDGTEGDGTEGDGTEGDGTEGDGTEGDGTEGDGTEGDGTEGDGTEGDGTEGDGTEGDGTEGDGTEGDGTEGDGTEGDGTEGDGTEDDGIESKPLTEAEMPDVSDVTDVTQMGSEFTDNAGNTWTVSEPATGEDDKITTVTLTREESVEHDAKLTQEELSAILGVTLTSTGADTYTYVDADGATVTVSVSDNSTETDTTTFTVILTQTKEVVGVDTEEVQPEDEDANEVITSILNQATAAGEAVDGVTTYNFSDDTADYVITETVTAMTKEELDALSNEDLAKLLGEGYSVNDDGKIVDAEGHVLTVSTEGLEGGSQTIIRTMVKTGKVSEETKENTEATAIANAVQEALGQNGIYDVNNLVKNEETGEYTYTYTDATGTHTYTIDTTTGAPVVKPVTAEAGADSTEENTVTVTATVTGEQIVETKNIANTIGQKNEEGKWTTFDGGAVTNQDTNENGETVLTVEKNGVTYTYTVTITDAELTDEEKEELVEEGKTYDFSQLQKISWTATTTTTSTSSETVTLNGITAAQSIVENPDGTSYTITVNNEAVNVTKAADGKYYDTAGTAYEITKTSKTVAEVEALLKANNYAYETVVAITDAAGNITGYTVTGTGTDGAWQLILPALNSYTVTQSTSHKEVDTWSGDVTNDAAKAAAIAAAKDSFIQKIIAKFKELAAGQSIRLGSGENAVTLERDKITDEDIAARVTAIFTEENYNTWIESGTAVNFSALSADELKAMLNSMAEDAKNTAYDFNNYYNQYTTGLMDASTATDAQNAAIKKENTPLITTVDGKTYEVTMTKSEGWNEPTTYTYSYTKDGQTYSVDAKDVRVANYHKYIEHLDLGIDGTMNMYQDGELVSMAGFILPADDSNSTGSDIIKIVWGDSADDVVLNGTGTGTGDGTAQQSSNSITKDPNTGLYEYNVRTKDPSESKFYRLEAQFVYDPVTGEDNKVMEFATKEAAEKYIQEKMGGVGYIVERSSGGHGPDDDKGSTSIQVYKEKAPLLAYGYMTRDANTCAQMLTGGYDLTLDDLTLIDGKVYAGGRGTLNMILNYEVIKSYVAEQQGTIGGTKTTTVTNTITSDGYWNYGNYTATEEKTYGNEYSDSQSYSFRKSVFTSETKNYNGELEYTYITAEGEKATVAVREIDAELDFTKVTTDTTEPGGDGPGGGGDDGGDPPPPPGGGDGGDGDVPVPAMFFFEEFVPIEEEPVPLVVEAPAIEVRPQTAPNGMTTIEDDEVPLAEAPETGDPTIIWGAMGLVSFAGSALLGKKKKEEEEA